MPGSSHLLVGGAGFIGRALLRRLAADGVTVFDNLSPTVHDGDPAAEVTALGADLIVGDVTRAQDLDALLDALGGAPESLVYLAAETGTGRSLTHCALNARINTLGLATLLDAMSARGVVPGRVVLTSTRAVYGEGPYRRLSDGATVHPPPRTREMLQRGRFEPDGLAPLPVQAGVHLPSPVSVYGATKLSQEHLLTSWCAGFDVPLTRFRLQNVYGAGQSVSNPYTGVLVHFARQAILGEPLQIYENGGITRDFVHVDDVAEVLAAAARGQGAPGLYDVGSGASVELEAVAARIAVSAGVAPPVRCDAFRPGDVRHASADTTRTRAAFGWTPHVDLADGLSALLDAVRHTVSRAAQAA